MSTVVVVRKSGQACIAADTLTTFGEQKQSADHDRASDKIQQLGDGAVSIVGSAAHALVLESITRGKRVRFDLRDRLRIFESFRRLHAELKEQYFLNPKEGDDENAPYESTRIDALLAHPAGIFGIYALREVYAYRRYWAIGSGAEYALGAMHAIYERADDADTVAHAGVAAGAEFDTGSGLPLTSRRFTLTEGNTSEAS
jgi:ATP-dependent protease HslVU (ClpYQ) peptidase subunit